MEFRAVDVIVTDAAKAIIGDKRISNNPALRSVAALAELETLHDELILRWQAKWTEAFLARRCNITKEEIRGHGDADCALDFASKALDAYNAQLAHHARNRFRIDNLVTYNNKGNRHTQNQ